MPYSALFCPHSALLCPLCAPCAGWPGMRFSHLLPSVTLTKGTGQWGKGDNLGSMFILAIHIDCSRYERAHATFSVLCSTAQLQWSLALSSAQLECSTAPSLKCGSAPLLMPPLAPPLSPPQVTELVRNHGDITLAIGDGANVRGDVI